MTIEQMRERLRALNLSPHGNREVLINRLVHAQLNAPSALPMNYVRLMRRRRIDTP